MICARKFKLKYNEFGGVSFIKLVILRGEILMNLVQNWGHYGSKSCFQTKNTKMMKIVEMTTPILTLNRWWIFAIFPGSPNKFGMEFIKKIWKNRQNGNPVCMRIKQTRHMKMHNAIMRSYRFVTFGWSCHVYFFKGKITQFWISKKA